MSLGERIYKLRTEKEMSQGDLADAWKYPGSQFQSGKQTDLFRNWIN